MMMMRKVNHVIITLKIEWKLRKSKTEDEFRNDLTHAEIMQSVRKMNADWDFCFEQKTAFLLSLHQGKLNINIS